MHPRPPDSETIAIRVSPGYDLELQHLLEEVGMYKCREIEESAETALVTVVATIGSGLTIKALVPVIVAFLNRHQNTQVEMFENGQVKLVSGTSPARAEKLIENARRSQEAMERRLQARATEATYDPSLDPGQHRPSGPATSA